MADPLSITPHASGAEAADGTGDAVDIEAHRACVRLRLDVSAITADNVTVTVQTAPDPTAGPWSDVGSFAALSAAGTVKPQTFGPCDRYVRVKWTYTGASPGATFAVYGEAHQLFALPDDVKALAIRSAALDAYTDNQLCDHCLRASDRTYDALTASFPETPITAWNRNITGATADLAAFFALKARGFNPEGPDKVIAQGAAMAEQYLQRIAEGVEQPANVTDQTPDAFEGGALIVADTQRGWGT